MNKIKKTIAIILCLVLATSSLAFADEIALISAPATDYAGHWAESTIQKWMDAGKISGYSDGSYKPDNNITRAEFVKLVNGTIDFNKKATVAYKDVTTADWFYDYVGIAQEIGYISGYSKDSFGPNDYITREQAASILARIQYLNGNSAAADKFSDKSKVSSWAAESVGAAFDAGFITGYNDGTFRPSNKLTRAEALTMLDNVLVNAKNVVIYKDRAELKDKVVAGDLIIAKTVGEGNVYLTNVEIKGEVKVLGGGLNSVYFNNVQVSNIEVLKDKVRLVFADGSVIENLTTGTETVLENTDGTIAKVTVSGNGEVTLTGKFDSVAVTGNANITLDDAVITTLTVSQPIIIEGTGTITTLEANSNGIKFEAEVTITKTVTGEGVTEKPVVVVEAPAGGGGGGGGVITEPDNPSFTVTIDTSESSPLVLNTEDFSRDVTLYDALVGILNDGAYASDISSFLNTASTKLNNMQVGEATGAAAIWDKAAGYLPVGINVSTLRAKFVDGNISISDLNSLLSVYNNSSEADLNQIITNLEAAGFDNTTFQYSGNTVVYSISSTKGTVPTGNSDIADFILNQILISDMTLGSFFDTYGTVTITSETTGDSVNTATITLQLQ